MSRSMTTDPRTQTGTLRAPLGAALAAAAVALSCTGDDDTGTGSTSDFTVLTESIDEGVLLSAWSAEGETLMVGGELGRSGMIVRYDGTRLCVESDVADGTLWWMHGPSDNEWWAVGDGGRIMHDTDGVRQREDVATDATLFGVYADGDEVWAVGGDVASGTGEIWRRTGGVWSLFAGDLPGLMFKTWSGWFVGDGQAYRLEGDELVSLEVDGARLVTVRGRDADTDVWAVGGSNTAALLHYAGESWESVDVGDISQPLNGIWTAPNEALYIAGNGGVTAIYEDDAWVAPTVPVTSDVLHAVWPHDDEMLWVGGNLLTTDGDYRGTIVRYGPDDGTLTPEPCP